MATASPMSKRSIDVVARDACMLSERNFDSFHAFIFAKPPVAIPGGESPFADAQRVIFAKPAPWISRRDFPMQIDLRNSQLIKAN